jgi:acyl transferase domain-containing protein
MTSEPEQAPLDGIAIIGMAGRFPGAPDLATFWQNLVAGKDTITRFEPADLASTQQPGPDFVHAHGILDDAAMFEADFFAISPREAERMDPQHRVFLEACSNALEDAGYVSADYPGEIGLFAGCSLNTYLLANLATDRAFLDQLTGNYQVGEFQTALGNDKDFLTTRAAYKLNLRGPVVTVQSACATSLVAICQASQALLNFQCDMALAGGVSITFPQHRGHIFQDGCNRHRFRPWGGRRCAQTPRRCNQRRRPYRRRHPRVRRQQRRLGQSRLHGSRRRRAGARDRSSTGDGRVRTRDHHLHRSPRHRDAARRSY